MKKAIIIGALVVTALSQWIGVTMAVPNNGGGTGSNCQVCRSDAWGDSHCTTAYFSGFTQCSAEYHMGVKLCKTSGESCRGVAWPKAVFPGLI